MDDEFEQPLQVTEGHFLWTRPAKDPHNHWGSFGLAMFICAAIVCIAVAFTPHQYLNIFIGVE